MLDFPIKRGLIAVKKVCYKGYGSVLQIGQTHYVIDTISNGNRYSTSKESFCHTICSSFNRPNFKIVASTLTTVALPKSLGEIRKAYFKLSNIA